MKSQDEIVLLAEMRLIDAECLIKAACSDGAYYLAGYSIELLLKARICKTFTISDFYLFNRARQEVYKPFKSHEYDQLLMFSGLYTNFNEEILKNQSLKKHWSLVRVWSDKSRYNSGKTQVEVQNFLISVREVSLWIRKHL